MLLGRTLFAGAIATGIVTASSAFTVASAQCVADATVNFYGYGAAATQANAGAQALRSAVASGDLAATTASAQGWGTNSAALTGLAAAVASVSSTERVDFYASGAALQYAEASGVLYRRIRAPFNPSAAASAEADADAQTYFLAKPVGARAYATLFGTTYQVGYANAYAQASLAGDGIRAIGVRQNAPAQADASAAVVLIAGGQGVAGCAAIATADAAVIIAGVRNFQVFGSATTLSAAECSTVAVYQPSVLYGVASVQGRAVFTRGAQANGNAVASANGLPVSTQTGVTGATAASSATGQARAVYLYSGRGDVLPLAQAAAGANVAFKGKATAAAVAAANAGIVAYGVSGSAQAPAQAGAIATKIQFAEGSAVVTTTARGVNQINDLTRAPAGRTHTVVTSDRLHIVGVQPRTIFVGA